MSNLDEALELGLERTQKDAELAAAFTELFELTARVLKVWRGGTPKRGQPNGRS